MLLLDGEKMRFLGEKIYKNIFFEFWDVIAKKVGFGGNCEILGGT